MPKITEKITETKLEEFFFQITETLEFSGGKIYRVLDAENKMGLVYFFDIFDNDMVNFFRANRIWGFFQKIVCPSGLRPIIKIRGLALDADFWIKTPEYGGNISDNSKNVVLWKINKIETEKISWTGYTVEELKSRRFQVLAVFSGFTPEKLLEMEEFKKRNDYLSFRTPDGRKIFISHGGRNSWYDEKIKNFFLDHSKNEWEVICCFPKKQRDFKVISEIKNLQEPVRVWFSHGTGEIFVTRDISPEELLLNNQIENSREQVGKVLRNLALSLPTE